MTYHSLCHRDARRFYLHAAPAITNSETTKLVGGKRSATHQFVERTNLVRVAAEVVLFQRDRLASTNTEAAVVEIVVCRK